MYQVQKYTVDTVIFVKLWSLKGAHFWRAFKYIVVF